MTAKDWKSKVAALGCLICQRPASLHHVREGQGMSQRSKDWMVVPLCRSHHQGPEGIHSPRTFYLRYRKDELDLLAETIERAMKER